MGVRVRSRILVRQDFAKSSVSFINISSVTDGSKQTVSSNKSRDGARPERRAFYRSPEFCREISFLARFALPSPSLPLALRFVVVITSRNSFANVVVATSESYRRGYNFNNYARLRSESRRVESRRRASRRFLTANSAKARTNSLGTTPEMEPQT